MVPRLASSQRAATGSAAADHSDAPSAGAAAGEEDEEDDEAEDEDEGEEGQAAVEQEAEEEQAVVFPLLGQWAANAESGRRIRFGEPALREGGLASPSGPERVAEAASGSATSPQPSPRSGPFQAPPLSS
mmetsp:Transcript_91072/g.294083  ORF Transcript_91072/g.294083 Transcript_91072/m.294083 type:complete len:130 (-) Transcript_91072:563-952(-)